MVLSLVARSVRAALVAVVVLGGCNQRRLTCPRKIAGLSTNPGDILWFGETHGTEESPRFVGDVVCQIARLDSVQLGLEIPQDEQMRIHQYLMDGDRAALIAGPFWSLRDGRSSQAMLSLLDRVREMRERGGRIEVVAFDAGGADRDQAMAKAVSGARNPNGVFVALSGNTHSRKTQRDGTTPAVAHLVAEKLPVRTHDVVASGGTMWGCVSTDPTARPACGEHPNGGAGAPGTAWTLGPAGDPSHDATYRVGPTTASPPAKR